MPFPGDLVKTGFKKTCFAVKSFTYEWIKVFHVLG